MQNEKIIAREPLLDADHRVQAYELVAQDRDQGLSCDEVISAIAAQAASFLVDEEDGWLLGKQKIFLEATPALLASGTLKQMPANAVSLSLTMAELAESAAQESIKQLHAQGYGISLRDVGSLIPSDAVAAQLAQAHSALRSLTAVELDGAALDIAAQADALRQARPHLQLVARHVLEWERAEACLAAGVPVFAGKIYLAPPAVKQKSSFAPTQSTILQLMDMVRQEADVRSLEAILKRDAALSFKLLRYINSVGFGLGSEIHSVQHAVNVLGYATLYKWLALLLGTTATGAGSAALMETAVIRGRFAELLGAGLLPKNELENLFVTGMFSVLDKLLGLPLNQILSNIRLPDNVAQALLTGDGIYGPFLALVRACETHDGQAQELADALFLAPAQVNKAHLSALAWSQGLQL